MSGDRGSLEALVKCPKCDAGLPVSAAEPSDRIVCGNCGREIPLKFSGALLADTSVDCCPVCDGTEFYIRKDFNPKLGVAAVATAAVISAVFFWFGRDAVAYGVLAAAVLLDLAIYRFLSELTVCYRCHTEFRGSYRRTAAGFDLHTADVLEQEYERRIGRR